MIIPPPQAGELKIAVVIPCYKVKRHVLDVIAAVGPTVERIYCVDDSCPEGSGDYIRANCFDERVVVLTHAENQGVGGAVMTGYRAAITNGFDVIVKIDGDGQMDPSLIDDFVAPIRSGEADYTKGNRFWDLSQIKQMPAIRRLGNLGLSFMAKASSGYWDTFDPTNGYTAIHARVASHLPFEAISKRYFFETDMLFRLSTLRAAVVDVPMDAHYADEESNLKISKIIGEFTYKHCRNFVKRIGYNYFLRDLPVASLQLIAGTLLLLFGALFGGFHWWQSLKSAQATPVGTIMISILCLTTGLQLLLAVISYDISNIPRNSIHRSVKRKAV